MSDDEDATARLLHLAGPRPDVPAGRAGRVREVVRGRWQASTRRRRVRRAIWSAAALAATAAMVVLLVRPGRSVDDRAPLAQVVATVERVEGTGSLRTGAPIRMGEWIETPATARAALRLGDGTSVRVDRESRARLLAPTVIELASGAVYLDTGRDSTDLEVRTAFGTAHDIGTQFEVRLDLAAVRVRVRSGIVELRRSGESVSARAGTELTMSAEGAVQRSIPADAPDWAWAANLAPAFEIEGRTVAAFLEHTAREQGWTLHYADARLTRDASAIVLHGSVGGLPPLDAIGVALSASGLGHRLEGEDLHVFRDRESR
jgi:FecR protein